MTRPPFIVAELSKNWRSGRALAPTGLLAEQFERVINTNHTRGYALVTFQLCRLLAGEDDLNETIIAVFRDEQP